MCGIVGIVSKKAIDAQQLQQAADSLQHRGPEHHAVWNNADNTIAFAHQRLSIIDRRSCAHQPLHYLERYVIIHNGEVYNYIELRKELEKKGYTFYTDSDTEVIAAAYAAYGNQCVQHFDGMFAFAIWDLKENVLFAARDRFGEKPFFFFYDEEQLVFASEMKALWKYGISKEVNHSMLYNFLTIGYTANPADPQETFYNNIHKLPAASFLTYAVATQQLVIEKYWQPDVAQNTSITDAAAIEQFSQLLSQSVQRRLRSDVAIGTSLSGGLDSSGIVALCAQHASATYTHQCFTAVFPHFEKDEQEHAAQVANKFNLKHFTIPVTEDNLLKEMDALMYHQEEPVASASALAQYKVYQTAKQAGVTVLLDGQGADEILGGYHKYYKWYWQQLYRQKQLGKSGELQAAKSLNVQEAFSLKNKVAALFPEFAAAMLQSNKSRSANQLPYLHPDYAFTQKRNLYYSLPATPDLNGALYYNTFVYGLEELLRMADRNSMAHAVEVRLPFLNHQLVEFIFSLPPHFKIRQGWTKWLLRKSMEGVLPNNIVWRKDKVGFEPPQQQWMHNRQVEEKIYEGKKTLVQQHILSPKALQSYKATAAHAADNFDWRFWTASFLFAQ